jgi:hypothetical protein
MDRHSWKRAAVLAEELEAIDAFASGLRLLPEGAALADQLGLPSSQSVRTALHAATPPPVALGFDQLATSTSMRARVGIVAHKLVPPPGFIRYWWPPAARNRVFLVAGYLYRPLWLLRHAPAGWRAWREAQRRVGPRR